MLEYSFGLTEEAEAVSAHGEVLNSGRVTADLKPEGHARDDGTSRRSGLPGNLKFYLCSSSVHLMANMTRPINAKKSGTTT